MTTGQEMIITCVESLKEAAPAGFAIALHINFTTPRLLLQTYDPEWVKHYSENGLVMSDPTVHWGFENEGTQRWSDLVHLDTAGVLEQARKYGMNYGLTCAVSAEGSRSIGSFSHSESDFDDDKAKVLEEQVKSLHKWTVSSDVMSLELNNALHELSVHIQSS